MDLIVLQNYDYFLFTAFVNEEKETFYLLSEAFNYFLDLSQPLSSIHQAVSYPILKEHQA